MAEVAKGWTITDATEPLRLRYDATGATDVSFGVSAAGNLTITPDGGTITLASALAVTGRATFSAGLAATGQWLANQANSTVIDFAASGRWLTWGPDNSTNGTVVLYSLRGNGSNVLSLMFSDTSGNMSFAQSISVGGQIDCSSIVRAKGGTAPSSGQGVEISYSGSTGAVVAFDRSGGVFKNLAIDGLTTTINANTGGNTTFGGNLIVNGTVQAFTGASGLIRLNTSDGSDNASLLLAGGGQADVNRGAWMRIYGNEAGGSGTLELYAGAVTGGHIILFTGSGTERVRLTNGGVLCLGTTVTSGAAAGEVSVANSKAYRGINSLGVAKGLVLIDGSDRVQLSPDGLDILWGRAMVALGGGAAATLGAIGGSGPASAAQVEWARVVNNAGNVRYFPLWA